MDVATWIALAALIVSALGPGLTSMRSGARREGKLDSAIAVLTKIADDHEVRLRKGGL